MVNLGLSKRDIEDITPTEKAFIIKAWEDKVVLETTLLRDAFLNAYLNANRKKNKAFMPMFKKKAKKIDKEIYMAKFLEVSKMEHDNSWVTVLGG